MPVAGSYNTVTKSPLGDQKSLLTVNVDGDSWVGTQSGDTGSMECKDGKVDGDTITWKMDMTVPMPMTLDCTATVNGDAIEGQVKAGMFGSFPMSGTRAS